MWAKGSFSISALYSHSQVIAREDGAESWHYGACVGPAAHQSNRGWPWGYMEVKERGGKDELFGASRRSGTSLAVSYQPAWHFAVARVELVVWTLT